MIKTLYNVGLALREKEEYLEYFQPYANPNTSGKEMKVVLAVFEDKKFAGIELEDFSTEKLSKYLFRKPSGPKGSPLAPTSPLYIDKKADANEENLRKFIERLKNSLTKNPILKPYLPDNYFGKDAMEALGSDLMAAIQAQELAAGSYLFSIVLKEGDTYKYVGDFKEYQTLLNEDAYNKYFMLGSTELQAKDRLCAVTNQQAELVWGKIDTLGFAVTDSAFIRGGFDQRQAHKMFPVSPEAAKVLEGARRVVFEKLSNRFFGLNYIILPHFITPNTEAIQKVLASLLRGGDDNTLTAKTGLIAEADKLIPKILSRQELNSQNVYYNILFYQEQQAQFLIKLQVSDIMPSRLANIYHAKEYVEECYRNFALRVYMKKKEVVREPFYISLQSFLPYFTKKDGQGKLTFHPYFFKLVEAIFYKSPLNEQEILKSFLHVVLSEFKQGQDADFEFVRTVKESFVLHQFLYHLGLFPAKPISNNMENQVCVSVKPDAFVAEHPHFFDDKAKEAAFYLGCLVEMLLRKQQSKIGSQVFKKYLNGLNVGAAELKAIFIKWKDKADQYGDTFRKAEWQDIEQYSLCVTAGLMESTKATKTDLSFAFATGMVVQKEYSKQQAAAAKNEVVAEA